MDRLHPFDSLFRATALLARRDNAANTPAGAADRLEHTPLTSEVRTNIERWISDIRAASPAASTPPSYAPVSSSSSSSSSSADDETTTTTTVSTPFSYATLPSGSSRSRSKNTESEAGSVMGAVGEEGKEGPTRGRSHTRARACALAPLYVAPTIPALARADACLVSPVSSGSRSSSRVSALSAHEDGDGDGDGDENEDWTDVPIFVIPPSPSAADDDDDDSEEEEEYCYRA